MNQCTIYHNPQCSKSRKTLELLHTHHLDPIIIEYLKTPLTLEELLSLRAHFELKEFVRTDEPSFKQLNLSLADEKTLVEAIIKEPILMQRPIVTYNGRAIIARPPEKVLALFSTSKSE